MPNRVICADCGELVLADGPFCEACGTNIRALCPDCRFEVLLEESYCGKCGTALGVTENVAAVPVGRRRGGTWRFATAAVLVVALALVGWWATPERAVGPASTGRPSESGQPPVDASRPASSELDGTSASGQPPWETDAATEEPVGQALRSSTNATEAAPGEPDLSELGFDERTLPRSGASSDGQTGEHYTVELNTVPAGAAIFIDGEPTEQTTPALIALTPATHRVRFRLPGFEVSEVELVQEEVRQLDGEALTIPLVEVVAEPTFVRPRKTHHVDPQYPRRALERGISGVVVLDVEIDARGAVTAVAVVEGPGSGLREAAAEAARQWVYDPALRNGEPVATTIRVEVRFRR